MNNVPTHARKEPGRPSTRTRKAKIKIVAWKDEQGKLWWGPVNLAKQDQIHGSTTDGAS